MGNLNIKNAAAIGKWNIPRETFKRWEGKEKIVPARRMFSGEQRRRVFDNTEAILYGELILAIQNQVLDEMDKLTNDITLHRSRNRLPDVGTE